MIKRIYQDVQYILNHNLLQTDILILIFSGCYKGQETISRLITYDGVKQRLWGISLSGTAEPGSPITVDGKKVCVIPCLFIIKILKITKIAVRVKALLSD